MPANISNLCRAVRALSIMAREAYWHDYFHCGADMTPECEQCNHFNMCQATDELDITLNKLEDV